MLPANMLSYIVITAVTAQVGRPAWSARRLVMTMSLLLDFGTLPRIPNTR